MKKTSIKAFLSVTIFSLVGCGSSESPSETTAVLRAGENSTEVTIIEPNTESVLLTIEENPAVILCKKEGGTYHETQGVPTCTTTEGAPYELWEFYEDQVKEVKAQTIELALTLPQAQYCQDQNGTIETSLDGKIPLCKTANKKTIPLEQYQEDTLDKIKTESVFPENPPEPPAPLPKDVLDSIKEEEVTVTEKDEAIPPLVPMK